MAYIGNSPANTGNYQILDDVSASFNGTLTSFALTTSSSALNPTKTGQLQVSINGVMQEPDATGVDGFKVSGSNVVFSSAPASGDVFWGVFLGEAIDIGIPSDDVVDTVHIKDDAVTAAKLANSINTEIAANTSKTGITGAQTSAITANTAKTGITGAQASAITANTAKVTNSTNASDLASGTVAAARLSTASTQTASDNSTKIATTAYADAAVGVLTSGASATHDTLLEIQNIMATDAELSSAISGLNHDALAGFVAGEHLDWAADQGSTNLHAGNYTDTIYTHPNHSGDVSSTADGATVIGANKVLTSMILDDNVTAAKLANSINTEIAANTAKVTNATHTGDVTGGTTLTIAVDAVDIAMLSATGTASATTYLRGDNAWSTVDALPTQGGHSGKFLTTDATNASWATLDTDANTTTKAMYEMSNTISANYSITSGNNALTAGPITINSSISVTIPSGSTWVIA